MLHDPRGIPLTTRSGVAAEALEAAVMALLGQKAAAGERLAAALAADPICWWPVMPWQASRR